MEQAWSGTKTFEGSRTLVADFWTKILWVGSSYRSVCQAFLRKKTYLTVQLMMKYSLNMNFTSQKFQMDFSQ